MKLPVENVRLQEWLDGWVELASPESVMLVHGDKEEYEQLAKLLVAQGTMTPLSDSLRPGSYVACSDPRDVARLESRTVICSLSSDDAGPTNNWRDPTEMKEHLNTLFDGSMRGRTMYVIPFSMGPVGSPFAIYGVEITDSAYVAISMIKMARVGDQVLRAIGETGDFVPAVHSVGAPIVDGEPDVFWPCNPTNTWVAHFPETREIWSFGSGYGGNALLGKKCLALRIASVKARDEGWLAEHMLILKLTAPDSQVYYVAGAFPSACGKTNLAMLSANRPGWKAETLGDDIAWIRRGDDGRLWAVNPEMGFFGVAPGTSVKTNPAAMQTISHDTIFTNTARTPDGDVWWEGMSDTPPDGLIDWRGNVYDATDPAPAAHPNARFTVSLTQAPSIAAESEHPEGVPLSAILFGGRRSELIPLVTEARSWEHGVFLGSVMASETTAAAEGVVGRPRRDPFAMLPFCGYHMGDYFGHWLSFGKDAPEQLPRIYLVNWFRKDGAGRFLWPGYSENLRVLSWIIDRLEGRADGQETPLGILPRPEEMDVEGLGVSASDLVELCSVDRLALAEEVRQIEEHYVQFGGRLPSALRDELSRLEQVVQGE
ncbi:MAG: phosphoenolpyruvate carboxykinase (GTP) [Ferrimicrobium sp.]